jgi:hypothetical protein
VADRISLTAVARILEQTCKWMQGRELPDYGSCGVLGSVIHDQYFDGPVALAELRHLRQG